MAAIRWTGKGLKLVGELLDSEAFEDWAESKGRQFIEEKLKTLPLKPIAGTRRAKRAVFSDASAVINSETFKAALEKQLIRLPTLLLEIAEHIHSKGPRTLVWTKSSYTVVVCPRGLVSEHYLNIVVMALKDSAELSAFAGLPATFLERTAVTAEEEWFSNITSPIPLPNNHSAVLAIDAGYGWNCNGKNGDFYVALAPSYFLNVTKGGMRKLIEETASLLSESKVSLAEIPRSKVDQIITELSVQRAG